MVKKKKTKKTKKSKKVSKRKVSRRSAFTKSSDNTNNIIYGALAAAIVALIIFALTLIAFFSCGKVIVDIKLIIIWFDLNFKFLIIFCPTEGVIAKKIQLQELSIS